MYFNLGSLPWQGLKAATKKQKYERISEKKLSTPVEVLCRGYPSKCSFYGLSCSELWGDYVLVVQLYVRVAVVRLFCVMQFKLFCSQIYSFSCRFVKMLTLMLIYVPKQLLLPVHVCLNFRHGYILS